MPAIRKPRPRKDWTGLRCGQMTVLHEVPRTTENTFASLWLCRCDCGKEKVLRSNHLDQTISCGCRLGRAFESNQKWRATLNAQYTNHQWGARRRQLVELPRASWETIVKQPCYYCGSLGTRNLAKTMNYRTTVQAIQNGGDTTPYEVQMNGVDRINSQRGYEEDNSVACCTMCNLMKSNLSFDAFVSHVTAIRSCQDGSTKESPRIKGERASVSIDHEYRHHKISAISRGLTPFDRTEWESIVFLSCHYCGSIDIRKGHPQAYMDQEIRDKYLVSINGIDRVDSSLGYTLTNAVPCCGLCNNMKWVTSRGDFLDQVNKIVNHLSIYV